MENFDWTSFTRKIAIKAGMDTMYKAWTTQQEIEKWFLQESVFLHADHTPVEKNEPVKAGDTYAWKWFIYETTEHGKITETNGKDFLQFSFAGDCLVDIKLTEQSGHTVVTLTQKNIPTDNVSKQQIRLGCHAGWSFYLVNLKSVYEGGLDLRNKEAEFFPAVNS